MCLLTCLYGICTKRLEIILIVYYWSQEELYETKCRRTSLYFWGGNLISGLFWNGNFTNVPMQKYPCYYLSNSSMCFSFSKLWHSNRVVGFPHTVGLPQVNYLHIPLVVLEVAVVCISFEWWTLCGFILSTAGQQPYFGLPLPPSSDTSLSFLHILTLVLEWVFLE